MRIAVKVCGLTRPADVQAAIAAGVDAIGVVFDRGTCRVSESEARILLDKAQEADIERVAVVGEADVPTCRRIRALGFDFVQAVASEALETAGLRYIVPAFFDSLDVESRVQAWRLANPSTRSSSGSLQGAINVDGAGGGGTGAKADWFRVARIARGGAVILSGGLRVENLAEAVRLVQPHAVDVSSGVEEAPGIKSHRRMHAFVQAVRNLESTLGESA
ncbi:MAG: phosphoribosylanthranilate isomerase [Myxococcales bacterium]|nr:phosphoribosylanthranilate isomerase [Myxococcales bacterium]